MARTWTTRNSAAVVALTLLAGSAAAGQAVPDQPKTFAKVRFAADFPSLTDSQWGFPIGGFGGIARGAPLRHVPLIMVHGNDVDHADWYPVRGDFRAAGWTDQELWALSYNGAGGANGTALNRTNQEATDEHAEECGSSGCPAVVTGDDVNVPDLYAFILAVRDYTGSRKFSIAAHSLGVTLARKVLKVHPELRADLVAFVGIAGANHGTDFCPPGSAGALNSCDEISAGSAWLEDLNGPGGADETYPPARWMTVYDGTGVGDPAFLGPTYAQSPRLEGADDNHEFPYTYHNDLRVDADIVQVYRAFIESAEAAAPEGKAVDIPDGRGVAAGGVAPALLTGLAFGFAWRRRRWQKHLHSLRRAARVG